MKEPFAKFIESELRPDALLITCGLPASFKTTVAEEIRKVKGYSMIQTDAIRREVLKGEDIFNEKVASDMDKRERVYNEVFWRADETLAKGKGVILDATFIKQSLRRRAAEIANEKSRPFVIMQTSCPEEISLALIRRRTRENYESNALTEKAYMNNKERFEAVDLDDLKEQYPNLGILHFIVDAHDGSPEGWYVTEVTRR